MLVPNQLIEVSWHSQTKSHYMKKGYTFTKYRDKFLVKAEDLSKSTIKKVKVICDYCGEEYEMSWFHYKEILDKNEKCACYNCRHEKRYNNDLCERRDSLYKKAKEVANKNGHKLISTQNDIKRNVDYIQYECNKHGVQSMRLSNYINGKNCPICSIEKNRNNYKLDKNEVVKRIELYGSKILNPEDYINQNCKNLKIICKECGNIFETSLFNYIQYHGQVCSDCSNKESKGERKIRHYLECNNIDFIQEKWFKDCRDEKPLPFDFYLPDYNMCIEFDGQQHYIDKGNFSTSLEYTKKHDDIKNNYCKYNNIKLLRIPYYDYKNIYNILNDNLILHKDIV